MMPHMARWLVGADHRWSLPVTLLATPALLLFADVLGRLLVPGELRVSVVSAFIGAPVLIFLVRRRRGGGAMMAPSRRSDSPAVCPAGRRQCCCWRCWSLHSGAVTLDFAQVFSALARRARHATSPWWSPNGDCPAWLMAILVGAALGVSGAIFQSLMRNPLGSPDVMGLNTGAWSGVLVAMVLFGQHTSRPSPLRRWRAASSPRLLVWALAWRNGIDTFRLIIIGIGIRAMLMAFNTWLLLQRVAGNRTLRRAVVRRFPQRSDVGKNLARRAADYPDACWRRCCWCRRMRLLEMGDDSACALGVRVERSRLLLMLVGGRADRRRLPRIAGPISFIALVAPHIARRLSGTARWGLTQAALCGAVLLLAADLLRSAAVYALSAAGGRGDRQPRRDLPHRRCSFRSHAKNDRFNTPLARRRLDPRLR